jgi:hypothetical protein
MKLSLTNVRREWGFNSSPEGQLILAVSSVQAVESKLNNLLGTNLIWPEILTRAIACDLAPLLYYRLKDLHAVRSVPPAVMDRLKRNYQWHAARNMNLYAKLQEVGDAFAGEKIPLILLKGAVLADLIYGDVALRPMRDVDILVRKSDLDAADELLRRMGYTPNETYRPEEWFRNFHHNIPYLSRDRSLILELHHNIVPPTAPVTIPAEDLWQDARVVDIMNEEALILSPEKFILHLCVHLAYDDRFYRSLRALSDIAATIAFYKETIDWTKFISHVRAYKADRSVYYALWLAYGLVHAEVPLAVLESLSKSQGNSLLNNFVLKRLIQRSISSFENEHTVIPAWVVKSICGELLISGKTCQSLAMLWHHFPPQYLFKKLSQAIGQKS